MGWLSRFIDREVDSVVRETVRRRVPEIIEERLPGIMERHLTSLLQTKPDVILTKVGFGWALAVFLRKHWPDISTEQAAKWLWEYIDTPYGTKGYTWTLRAAEEVAARYVEEFGEAHDR